MASLYKRGKTFWVSYTENGKRKQRSLKTDNPRLAEQLQKQIEVDLERGIFVTPSKTPLPELIETFLRQRQADLGGLSHSSYLNDLSRLRVIFGRITPSLESNAQPAPRKSQTLQISHLEEITPDLLREYLADRALLDGCSPATVNADREIVHRLFQFAIDTGRYTPVNPAVPNPVSKVKRVKKPEQPIRYLNAQQITEQLEALENHPQLLAMVATLILAGLRREELVWLTPVDVLLKKGLIHIRAKTVDGKTWAPKTRKNRIVPISSRLRSYLDSYTDSVNGPWLFPSPDSGGWWRPDSFYRYLRQHNTAAGLEWSSLDYRHTFGSQLAQKGVSLLKIAKLMGNTYQVAERHYAALVPERIDVDFDIDVQEEERPDNIIPFRQPG